MKKNRAPDRIRSRIRPSGRYNMSAQVGIGIDIERVDRFIGGGHLTKRFLSRTFTQREQKYCGSKSNPPVHFAGTFAAKEAAVKAIRAYYLGRLGIADFEVFRDGEGAPSISYSGNRTEVKAIKIEISISHTTDNAVAVALAYLPG